MYPTEIDDGLHPNTLHVDLHTHTSYSPDAVTSPAELVERATMMGLDRIAVTDHGEIEGALRAHELDPGRVIIGEEIRCRGGTELIGLYLTERIPYGLSVEETAERIRHQGGLIYAPHPFAYARRPTYHARAALAVADIVEIHNARAFLPRWNRLAESAALERGLPCAAGSDAHFPHEIGHAFTTFPSFDGPDSLRRALAEARIGMATITNPLIHLASLTVKVTKLTFRRVRRWPRPDRPG